MNQLWIKFTYESIMNPKLGFFFTKFSNFFQQFRLYESIEKNHRHFFYQIRVFSHIFCQIFILESSATFIKKYAVYWRSYTHFSVQNVSEEHFSRSSFSFFLAKKVVFWNFDFFWKFGFSTEFGFRFWFQNSIVLKIQFSSQNSFFFITKFFFSPKFKVLRNTSWRYQSYKSIKNK